MGNNNGRAVDQEVVDTNRVEQVPAAKTPVEEVQEEIVTDQKVEVPEVPEIARVRAHEPVSQSVLREPPVNLTDLICAACPCCGTVLQISSSTGTVHNSIPPTAYITQGIVPQTFFQSPYNTQGWLKKHPKARRELGINN